MKLSADRKIAKARSNLIISQPFFGTLALRLKPVVDPNVDRIRTDGNVIRYNPGHIDQLTLSQTQGAIAHAVMHLALMHHIRRGNRNEKKWQKACDYAIDDLLKQAGFDLPDASYTGSIYSGKAAEEIYTLLPGEDDQNNGGGGKGKGKGKGKNTANSVTGGEGPGNADVDDSPKSEAKGATVSQQRAEENDWKTAVAQAAHVAKQAGKLPAGFNRMIEDLLTPIIPWRDQLRRFMTEKANDDFAWLRPNRRFVANGLYLPSRISEDAMGSIVVAIDTSGSIDEKLLSEFAAEVRSIVDECKPNKTYVVYCDAAINRVDTFGRDDELVITPCGGGGTSFIPPFDWVRDNDIVPKCLIYLTDGYGDFPDPQQFPVLWCINNEIVVPPHGEHLVIARE